MADRAYLLGILGTLGVAGLALVQGEFFHAAELFVLVMIAGQVGPRDVTTGEQTEPQDT